MTRDADSNGGQLLRLAHLPREKLLPQVLDIAEAGNEKLARPQICNEGETARRAGGSAPNASAQRQVADLRLDVLDPMAILRKTLVVALFVLLSACLFTLLLPFVCNTLMAFYGYQSASRTQGKLTASDTDKPQVMRPTPLSGGGGRTLVVDDSRTFRTTIPNPA